MAETFSMIPQYTWQMSSQHKVLVSTFESGKEQRRYKGRRPKQWKLKFAGTWATISPLVDFHTARKGSFGAFNWTPPGETTAISVRFKDDEISVERQDSGTFAECEVTFQEVL